MSAENVHEAETKTEESRGKWRQRERTREKNNAGSAPEPTPSVRATAQREDRAPDAGPRTPFWLAKKAEKTEKRAEKARRSGVDTPAAKRQAPKNVRSLCLRQQRKQIENKGMVKDQEEESRERTVEATTAFPLKRGTSTHDTREPWISISTRDSSLSIDVQLSVRESHFSAGAYSFS